MNVELNSHYTPGPRLHWRETGATGCSPGLSKNVNTCPKNRLCSIQNEIASQNWSLYFDLRCYSIMSTILLFPKIRL